MLRAAALSLLVLVSVIVMLPTSDSSAHHSGRSSVSRRSHMNRRHSRAWWRRYRARLRRNRAALRRQQAILRARGGTNLNAVADSHKSAALPDKLSTVSSFKNPVSGWNPALPAGWSRRVAAAAGGEMKFVVNAQDGRTVGEARFAVINMSASVEPAATARTQRKMLGGVSFTELRRTVIDKMVAANGWVTNDITREIGGRPVFIVLAQTAASSDGRVPQQSWVFYFTEVEGRIYSLATNSLLEFADRVANESTELMASFHVNRSTLIETSLR
ncbi:MAG: hypothetical protein QOH25_463 [Acidobacteriota bacterium]|jgi:hypothetical protein|nr:hypothetical protein [Acidobacteriota bacterium]